MNLPQDSRAPHRQQRWIELENVGAETIPAFGICEVVDTYRPETAGVTPGDGPTVIKVKRPTKDALPDFVINFAQPIPVGKRGRPGTNDYPCYVLYSQTETPVSGQIWGTVKDSFLIGRGRQGVAIIGDANAADGTVRVFHQERLVRITPIGTSFLPGEHASCKVLRWDGTEYQQTDTEIEVHDPMFRTCALVGEELWAETFGDVYQTVCEYGLSRRGIAVSRINPNSTGSVGITAVSLAKPVMPSCQYGQVGPFVEVCYRTREGAPIEGEDEVNLRYHPEFRKWFVMPIGSGTKIIRFELLTALPLGGKATGVEIKSGPGYEKIGDPFPIKDPYTDPGCFRYDPASTGQAGYRGFCCIPDNPDLEGDEPIREIIYMELIANSINFQLKQDISGSSGTLTAQATITHWYQGKDPATSDLVSAGEIAVFDPQRNYPKALEGALGKARYNNRLHRYEIIECNQMCIAAKGTPAAFCPSASTVQVTGLTALTFPPYGQDPPITFTSALNPYALSTQGGEAFFFYDKGRDQFLTVQVTHLAVFLMKEVTFGAADCTISMQYQAERFSMMGCGELDSGGGNVEFVTQDVVTGFSTTQPTSGDPTCEITATKNTLCVLKNTVSDDETVASFTPQLVVQDLFLDGSCIMASVELVYVLCFSDPEDVCVIDTTTCGSGSGS